MVEQSEQVPQVEAHDGIAVIRGSGNTRQWNGIHYKQGMSAKNARAKALSMNVATIPPGGVAYAHIHVDFEVMLYILEGTVRHDFGPGLKHSVVNEAGDFIFIEPGVPHEVYNVGEGQVVAVVARSSADEWDKIIPYDRTKDRLLPPAALPWQPSTSSGAAAEKSVRPDNDTDCCQ